MSKNTVSYEDRLNSLLSVADAIQDAGEREAYLRSILGEFARLVSEVKNNSGLLNQINILHAEKAQLLAENLSLKKAVMTDERTGLPNRNYFVAKILPKLERFYSPERRAYPTDYIIVYFDLDGLSDINNKKGHSAGDEAIVKAAKIIKSSIREEDWVFRIDEDENEDNSDIDASSNNNTTQWIGRSNKDSDEFTAVIAINDEDVQRVMLSLLNRIRLNTQRINANTEHEEERISISIGFAVASDFTNLEDALDHADKEMYNNKRNHYFAKGKMYHPIVE